MYGLCQDTRDCFGPCMIFLSSSHRSSPSSSSSARSSPPDAAPPFWRLGKFKSKEWLRSKGGGLFFFRPFLRWLFPKHEWENLYFSISICKQFYQLAYAVLHVFLRRLSRAGHERAAVEHSRVARLASTPRAGRLDHRHCHPRRLCLEALRQPVEPADPPDHRPHRFALHDRFSCPSWPSCCRWRGALFGRCTSRRSRRSF